VLAVVGEIEAAPDRADERALPGRDHGVGIAGLGAERRLRVEDVAGDRLMRWIALVEQRGDLRAVEDAFLRLLLLRQRLGLGLRRRLLRLVLQGVGDGIVGLLVRLLLGLLRLFLLGLGLRIGLLLDRLLRRFRCIRRRGRRDDILLVDLAGRVVD